MKRDLVLMLAAGIVAVAALLTTPDAASAQSPPSGVNDPADLTARSGAAAGSVDLSWTPSREAQYHFIAYIPSSVTDLNAAAIEPVAAVGSATIAGLDPGTEYLFVVIGGRWEWDPADFGPKWSSWSNLVTATAALGTAVVAPGSQTTRGPVGNPTGLGGVPGPGTGTVGLIWTPSTNAQYHFVAYIPAGNPDLNSARILPVGPVGITAVRDLQPGVDYWFVVIGGRWEWDPADFGAKWSSWSSLERVRASGTAFVGTPATDREALVEFYNATGGANWIDNSGWLSDAPMGQWHGVTTDGEGRVVRIDLGRNELNGQLPGVVGNLDGLTYLALWGNDLSGPVPDSLSRLSHLQGLDVGGNQLIGSLPTWLGDLTGLTYLSLWGNKFESSIPPNLGNLTNLRTLDIRDNQLTERIPPELGNLLDLEVLLLSRNRLSGPIPPSLGNLAKLAKLELQDNLLTGDIPPELGTLSKLEIFYLRGNALTGCMPAGLQNVATNDLDRLALSFCGVQAARQFSHDQLATLFDEIIRKTEQREAFSPIKESDIGFSHIEDMRKLRSEFIEARTETDLYYALLKLSNARRDRHLWVLTDDDGLRYPDRASCVSAPIHVLPDLSDVRNPTFFVADLAPGHTSPTVGDTVVAVNGRSMADYIDTFTPWTNHSTLAGLYWRMAHQLPKQIWYLPPHLYSGQLELMLENSSGRRYEVSLPYSYGCYYVDSRHSTAGFDLVMERVNFNVLVDRNRQLVLLQWRDFERDDLIQDVPALMEYAQRERILDYDMIIDVSWSGGGSGGAYAIQRLVDEPFRVTFGNVRLSDLGIERVQRYVDREPIPNAPDIFGLNLSRSWLYEWASTAGVAAINRGAEYTDPVPFKLAHLPKDSDGMLQPAPVHFRGDIAIINARVSAGSHLDQFMAMFVDNDLATFIDMPTGGFSNTWEGEEVLTLPGTEQRLFRFMWSIGHTIRPNGEILEGNAAQPDIHIAITRDNFQGYHQMLFDRALAELER